MLASAPPPVVRRPWYRPNLTQQILIGLVIGIGLGIVAPAWAVRTDVIRDIFLRLIKAMIAPLVFGSVVQGIAGTGDIRKVGRIGGKALLYFEIITTAALAVGLLAVNLLRPGAGIRLDASSLANVPTGKPLTFAETILHTFPSSLFDALARNDVLQIVVFATIFAIGLIATGEAGAPVLAFCSSLTQVMFKFAGLVMLIAPYGVGAAIAVTVGQQGPMVLLSLAKLVLTLYGALVVFIVVVLGSVIHLTRVPLRPFVRAVREPFIIAFATANSEAALPKAFELMERFGVPRSIVAFVLPAGYTFNLDGTTLYLAIASVFVAQASEVVTGIHFGLMQQVPMMLTLMLTSKGVAAVPRASLVVLFAALQSFHLPEQAAVMILGVDALLDMARTSVNVLGNCLASVVVARWEGEFDEAKAHANFGPGTDAS